MAIESFPFLHCFFVWKQYIAELIPQCSMELLENYGKKPVKILSEKYLLEEKNDPFRYRGQGSFFQVSFFIYSESAEYSESAKHIFIFPFFNLHSKNELPKFIKMPSFI